MAIVMFLRPGQGLTIHKSEYVCCLYMCNDGLKSVNSDNHGIVVNEMLGSYFHFFLFVCMMLGYR